MPHDKYRRRGSGGADGGRMVQRRVAPGKRTLTARIPAAQRSPDAGSAGSADSSSPVQRKTAGPDYGGPLPPLAELRAGMEEEHEAANQIAAAGIAGPGQGLPHGEAIQRSF